jgi:cytochrome b
VWRSIFIRRHWRLCPPNSIDFIDGLPVTVAIKVWDPIVRIGHWLLVATIVLAWLTRRGWGNWHEWIGYAALATLALRIIWGIRGPKTARFADFVRSPATTVEYARAMLSHREARFVGHNPLGGWMIVVLLLTVLLVGMTGWLYTTDRFWGVEWVETLHATLAEALLWLAGVHVAGVLLASYRHRENLIAAMLHGRKRPS